MEIRKNKCDYCNKEVTDRYKKVGWINGYVNRITVSKGINKKGKAKTKCKSNITFDFCSFDCFKSYFKTMLKI